jgi:uridine nucleosidase
VHGNASAQHTAQNAARCLHAFGAREDILVYPGADKPLIKPKKHDPEIHGEDGLGGVEGLSDADDPTTLARFAVDDNGVNVRALEGMAQKIKATRAEGHNITVVSCGPCTNIALFVSIYPDLLEGVEFVFMGGGIGLGNRSAVAG